MGTQPGAKPPPQKKIARTGTQKILKKRYLSLLVLSNFA